MRKWLVLGVVLTCAACGGSGGAKVTARIVGGQPRERALAREILQKLSPSPVSVVRFTGTRMDVKGHRVWVGASWEEYVFAYSYAVAARQRQIPISGVSLDLGFGPLDNALANAPGTPIGSSILSRFEDRLRADAKAADASIWFRTLRPGPVALEATLTTKRPGPFLQHDAGRFLRRTPQKLFGFLFRVAYPSGKIAFARGNSPGGTTTSWDPPLFGCVVSLIQWDPPDSTGPPPTCPA